MFSYSPKLRSVLCILYSRLDDTINMLLLSKKKKIGLKIVQLPLKMGLHEALGKPP